METKNKTPTEESEIKITILKLRQKMREDAKLKNLNFREELNYVYKQLGYILKL